MGRKGRGRSGQCARQRTGQPDSRLVFQATRDGTGLVETAVRHVTARLAVAGRIARTVRGDARRSDQVLCGVEWEVILWRNLFGLLLLSLASDWAGGPATPSRECLTGLNLV